jgi:cold shock protein
MMQTIKYKQGYIHLSYPDNIHEVVRVQVDPYAYLMEVKSIHSAKIMITKHLKRISKPQRTTGVVKWFNDAKGIGYLTCKNTTADVFIHYSAIMTDGFKTVSEGQEVEFDLIMGVKGAQAFNVKAIK